MDVDLHYTAVGNRISRKSRSVSRPSLQNEEQMKALGMVVGLERVGMRLPSTNHRADMQPLPGACSWLVWAAARKMTREKNNREERGWKQVDSDH